MQPKLIAPILTQFARKLRHSIVAKGNKPLVKRGVLKGRKPQSVVQTEPIRVAFAFAPKDDV